MGHSVSTLKDPPSKMPRMGHPTRLFTPRVFNFCEALLFGVRNVGERLINQRRTKKLSKFNTCLCVS
jgi:hypothetical protein